MDNFNNFFDEQNNAGDPKTPVYHTHDPKGKKSKSNFVVIFCIVMTVMMCILVVVNVIVLASMKETIAEEYAATMASEMRKQYEDAINEVIANSDIKNDVINKTANQVLNSLGTTIGEAASPYSVSVARLYLTSGNESGIGTGFLITDSTDDAPERYLLTNAHCARTVVRTLVSSGGFPFGGGTYRYEWASFNIKAVFEGDTEQYTAEVFAYGAYTDSSISIAAENDQPDLAILKITGTQPDNEKHPALRLSKSDDDVSRGTPVAVIGNPEGIGSVNSITSGTVSCTGISYKNWGSGTFIMTDAAINGGNSGGPVLDRRGLVVGVVESKLADDSIDNMGFALSAGTIYDFIKWVEDDKGITLNCNYGVASE